MIDTIKALGSNLTAWFLIGGCFWFLNRIVDSIADPDLAAIPEGQLGIIVGGMIAILTLAGQSVFQAEATRSATRQQQAAFDTGLMTPTPPAPTNAAIAATPPPPDTGG